MQHEGIDMMEEEFADLFGFPFAPDGDLSSEFSPAGPAAHARRIARIGSLLGCAVPTIGVLSDHH